MWKWKGEKEQWVGVECGGRYSNWRRVGVFMCCGEGENSECCVALKEEEDEKEEEEEEEEEEEKNVENITRKEG